MNPIDNAASPPQPLPRAPRSPKGFSVKSRPFAVAALVTCGLALGGGSLVSGVGSLAAAAQESIHSAWSGGARLGFVQRAAAFLLDSVGATAAQESKAHDIIAAAFADIAPDPKQREAFRKQALDLLGAPTIDRVAVEKLRADAVASFDEKSKKIVSSLLEIVDELTPAQRAALTARIEEIAQHGPMGGPWGGPMGGWRGPPWGGPMGGWTPDNSTDKD
jgi:periplasmic protein CpxP/Spy